MATKILVVDDDQRVRRFVRECLMEAGFEVVTAGDVQEGVTQLQQSNPALIISDIWMPGMDGYHLSRLAKRVSTAPVLLMTGVPSEAMVLKEMNVGADGMILKPFDRNDLLAKVRKLLDEHPNGGLINVGRSAKSASQDQARQSLAPEQYILQIYGALSQAGKDEVLRLVQSLDPANLHSVVELPQSD